MIITAYMTIAVEFGLFISNALLGFYKVKAENILFNGFTYSSVEQTFNKLIEIISQGY